MFGLFKKNKKDIKTVAEKQLRENISSVVSLRDYDTGKKDISTDDIEKRLPNIRIAPRP